MNEMKVLSAVACVSVFLATGAMAEILGVQQGFQPTPKTMCQKRFNEALQVEKPLVWMAAVRVLEVTN